MTMKRLQHTCFTLVELIVSMAIFLVIMLVLVTMLSDTVKLSRKRKQQADIYHQQQVLSTIFSRDLQNMVARSESGAEIYLQFSQSAAAFVTTSSIGDDVNNSTTTPLYGVLYSLESDSKLYRGIVPYSIPAVNTDLSYWVSLISDSDVIAENVDAFSIIASWPDGSNRLGPTDQLPVLIDIKVKQYEALDSEHDDPLKTAHRTFEKRIFISGSDQ